MKNEKFKSLCEPKYDVRMFTRTHFVERVLALDVPQLALNFDYYETNLFPHKYFSIY